MMGNNKVSYDIIIRQNKSINKKTMDPLDNPQNFQNSALVQKSSKTGIFSNKRLLVIKTGYLYYFSQVPKGYKSHVPNILSTFTDLPKSSIQIKNILDIRLESAKSSNLIIKFYLKDMIDREDIRKSIDNQLFSMPNKKPNTQTDEWKFMFTTVLQCRLWYNALMKLKEYFKNLQHKFSDFVANFDYKRNSVSVNNSEGLKEARSQSDIKHLVSGLNSQAINSNSNNKNSQNSVTQKEQQKRNTEPIKFDASKFITPLIQKQPSDSSSNEQLPKKYQLSPIKQAPDLKQQKQTPKNKSSQNFHEEQEQSSQNDNYHVNISKNIQPQILQHHHGESINLKRAESFMKAPLKESHLIEPIDEEDEFKMRQMQDDIREEVRVQMELKVREEIEEKVKERLQKQKQEQMRRYRKQVELKEMKIQQLQTQMHIKHLANMEQQKRIEEEKKQLQIKIIEQQQKLNHARIDFEKQLKLQKGQNQKSTYQSTYQNNNKMANGAKNQHRNQSKWFDGQEDSYQANDYNPASYQANDYNPDSEQQPSNNHPKDQPMNSIEATNPTFPKNIHVNEFSVQTDEQDYDSHEQNQEDSFEPNFNFSKELSLSKELNLSKETKIRNSFFSDHGMTQRNILGNDLLRIQDGFNNSILQANSLNSGQDYDSYDYFVQIAKIHEPGINSQQKITRELKLLNYLNFIQQKAVTLAVERIDSHKPTSCQNFDKGIFSFELACAPGKIMNIGGENKLIYSNKMHQNLKRTFKTYQNLQGQIMKILKSKATFPVRVPLCVLVEYRGYTVLAKVDICTDGIDLPSKEKQLKHLLPPGYLSAVQLSKTVNSSHNQSQFYMIKLQAAIKLTNQQKPSQLLKFSDELPTVIKSIETARKSNVSLCYEKLMKEHEEFVQSSQEQQSQLAQNSLELLKLIKLMRQLKKLFKSMEPFDQTQPQNQDRTSNNRKSPFVEYLLSNPTQLISLIPSDTDLSTINTQCGYFYAFLQFFLGIRIHQPPSIHTSHYSYDLLPISRTYHFSSLSTHQHISRAQKHLVQSNLQPVNYSLTLLKQISPQPIEPFLLQIKILLKQKNYPQAQNLIHSLKSTLPYHNLTNIELNAYLIECYAFIGLETQLIKSISSSIQYVSYIFGDKKNVFENNLHLLMAQTLLRIGKVNDSIKIYKSLLKHDKAEKRSILISYAETLVKNMQIDPNQTIPFLLQFMDEIDETGKKIDLLLSVAKLYARTKRIDKRFYYLQTAFQLCISNKNYANLLQLYQLMIQEIGWEKKEAMYKTMVGQVDGKFWMNEENTKKFNTINLYQMVKSNDVEENRMTAVNLREILKENSVKSIKSGSVDIADWAKLSQLGSIISQRKTINVQQNFVSQFLQSINFELLLNLHFKQDKYRNEAVRL